MGPQETTIVLNSLGMVREVLDGQHVYEKYMLTTTDENVSLSISDNKLMQGGAMYSLGRVLLQEGKYSDAETMIAQALEAFEQEYGVRHPRVAYALTTLASCLMLKPQANGEFRRQALKHIDRAVSVLQGSFGTGNLSMAEPGGPLPLKSKVCLCLISKER